MNGKTTVSFMYMVLTVCWCNIDYLVIDDKIKKGILTPTHAKRDIEAVQTNIKKLLETVSSVSLEVDIESLSSNDDGSIARDKYSEYLSILKDYLVNGYYSQLKEYGESLEKSCYICKQLNMKDKESCLKAVEKSLSNVYSLVHTNCMIYKALCMYWSCVLCSDTIKEIMIKCREMVDCIHGLSKERASDLCLANVMRAQAAYYSEHYAPFIESMKERISSIVCTDIPDDVAQAVDTIKKKAIRVYHNTTRNLWKRIHITNVIKGCEEVIGNKNTASLSSNEYVCYPELVPSFHDDVLEEWLSQSIVEPSGVITQPLCIVTLYY